VGIVRKFYEVLGICGESFGTFMTDQKVFGGYRKVLKML
jgi:hypothetical protein